MSGKKKKAKTPLGPAEWDISNVPAEELASLIGHIFRQIGREPD